MDKKLFVVPILCMSMFICQGCSENEASSPSEETPTITFEGDDELPPFSCEGGSKELNFTVSTDWTASVDGSASDWVSVSPSGGESGSYTMVVSTAGNNDYDERNASVSINYGNKKHTFTVVQKQKDALILSSNKVELEAEECEFSLDLQTNVSLSYEIEADAQSWLTPASGSRGLTAATVTFKAAANENTAPRQGVITFKGGDNITEKVTVYQMGNEPALLLTQSEYTVGCEGEVIKVEIKSNTSYSIEMPEEDWISEERSRGLSTYTHYFSISENDTYDARSAEIKFTDKNNGLEQTLKINQLQKDAIILAQNLYEMPAEGGNLEFDVQTNVDFDVTISDAWITESASRGLVNQKLRFEIAPNENEEAREAEITLKKDDIVQRVKVVQAGKKEEIKPYLEISMTGYTADKDGDSFNVRVQSNVEYDVYISDSSWIIESGQTNNNHSFKIMPNLSLNVRNGYILFTNKEYGLEKKLIVTQAKQNTFINISESVIELAASDNSLAFVVETNTDLNVSFNAGWLTMVSGNITSGTNNVVFNVESNTTTQAREATITFTAPDNTSRSVRVIQNGMDAPYMNIITSPDVLSAERQEITIVADSNIDDFELSYDNPDWISFIKVVPQQNQDGTYRLTYTFTVDENKSENVRANKITFMNSKYGFSKSVDISQEGQEIPENVTGNGNESYDKEEGGWEVF